MPLHLQHHKSYHPYNKDNIDRVRRDEERAKELEREEERKTQIAESQDRLDILRRQKGTSQSSRTGRDDASSSSSSQKQSVATSSGKKADDQSRAHEKNEGYALIRNSQDLQPWYQSEDLQSGKERSRSQEQRLEATYKDSIRKRSDDPLRQMPMSASSKSQLSSSNEATRQGMSRDIDLRAEADDREAREKARVAALLRSKQPYRIESTPTIDMSSSSYYNDQYSHEDVRAAKRVRHEQRDFHLAPEVIDPGDTEEPMSIANEIASPKEGDDIIPVKTEEKTVMTEVPHLAHAPQRPTSTLQSRASGGSDSSASSTDSRGRPKESMYPTIFGEMIKTVMQTEDYLFTNAEKVLLQSFFDMDYEARHLFARLIQRRNAWHRVDKLNYDFDVSDKVAAVSTLCTATQSVTSACASEKGDVYDTPTAMDRFCLSEQDMEEGFEEPLNLLTVEELKVLAKNMNRLKGVTNKASIIAALLTTRSQGTLFGFGRQTSGSSSPTKAIITQASVLREQLRDIVGGCIRVCPRVQSLIDRIALVYYRGAELGGSALTTAVLSRSRKRSYPSYTWKRSERLFASRAHLLGMQRALELEMQMEYWIEWESNPTSIAKALAAFQAVYGEWKEAVREAQSIAPDVHDLGAYNRMRFHPGWPLTRVVYKGVFVLGKLHRHDEEAEVLRSLLAQKVFRRGRRGDWYDRLALITAHYPPSKKANDVRKAKRDALAISIAGIEDPDTHLIYHDTLQRRITRLESQLNLPYSEKHDFSYAKLRKCEDRIFRGVRLDRMMGERKGIFGTVLPVTGSSNVRFDKDGSGEAIYKAPLRKVVKVEKSEIKTEKLGTPEPVALTGESDDVQVERRDVRKDMHTVWRGLDGDPCRVESLVLQHYAQEEYKGYHCEGGILTMLFALLLWDVLFVPIDGVFETPYQRQPLDLMEDTFAIVRGPQLRSRLMEIENGRGPEFIRETDDRERPRKTWAIGCRWDDYSLDDLLEIAECMGGKALAVVCQMLAEEWNHCAAGMPDLCVWRYADRKIRFCEVKGPGDKLSEKQKLWIDVLLRAGLYVEVSKVEELVR